MSKKLLQFIVVFQAILIIICFGILIYGMYIKIGKNQNNINKTVNNYSLKLSSYEKIADMEVISNKEILFKISKDNEIYALIYNIEEHTIESEIKR